MSMADPLLVPLSHSQQAGQRAASAATTRDPRLDFFRGIAMFIILIAHVPNNWLTLWIPARFGFSDATETFVFCSGMASAIAFGRVFQNRGLVLGTARVWFRIWQVYWAHLGLFLAVATSMVLLNGFLPDGRDYVGQLNLYPFFNNPQPQLVGLVTLTYVPNYFDILPMYLVILAMMPVMIALARVHVGLMILASLGVWLAANLGYASLPAEPWTDRSWFFNPFGWQLAFFTGFALMSGWIPAPPVNWKLFCIAVVLVLLTVPFAYYRIYTEYSVFLDWRKDWTWWINKSDFGIFRYIHFLSTAYVAWVLVGAKGSRLLPPVGNGPIIWLWQTVLSAIMKVGQQSLAVFVSSMFLARFLGVAFDVFGRTHFTMLVVNLAGFAMIIAIAYAVGWFKSTPWRKAKV